MAELKLDNQEKTEIFTAQEITENSRGGGYSKRLERPEFYGIYVIKTIAIFFVFLFHFFYRTDFHEVYIGNANLVFQSIFRWLTQICVPLFFLSTGFLQENRTSSRKYYLKIFHFLLTYFVITIITIIARFLWLDDLNGIIHSSFGEFLLDNIIGIFTFQTIGYSWYIGVFALIYLGTPLLNLLWLKLKTKTWQYLFVLFLALLMWVNLFGITMHLYPLLFFYLGKIIREKQPQNIMLPALVASIAILLLEVLINIIVTNNIPSWVRYFDNYGSILPVFLSVSFFLIFINCKCNNLIFAKCVKTISIATFEIYLFAFILDYTLYPLLLNAFYLPSQELKFVLFPIVPIISISCCFVLAVFYRWVRNKLYSNLKKQKQPK